MPVLDLSAYKPVPGTLEDANQIANGFTAIQTCINGLDNNNFAAGKIFDPAKLMQDAAVDGDAMVWDNTNSKWVPGSAMPAASVKPGLYKLWDSVEAGVAFPAASITTSTLPQTYKHLRVKFVAMASSGVTQAVQMRINGDTGANYGWDAVVANSPTAVAGSSAGSATVLQVGNMSDFASSPAGGLGVIEIPDYARTIVQKGFMSLSQFRSASAFFLEIFGGMWFNPAAITTLTFLSPVNFVAGTRITVYGEA